MVGRKYQKTSWSVSLLQGKTCWLPDTLLAGSPGPEVWGTHKSAVVFHCQHLSPVYLPAWSIYNLYSLLSLLRWFKHNPAQPSLQSPIFLWSFLENLFCWNILPLFQSGFSQIQRLLLNTMDYRKRSQLGLFCTSWLLRNFWFFLAPLSSRSKILLSDHVHSIQTASQWASTLYPASSYPSPPKAYDFVPLWARFTSIWLKEHQVPPPRCLFFYDLHFQRHLWPQYGTTSISSLHLTHSCFHLSLHLQWMTLWALLPSASARPATRCHLV